MSSARVIRFAVFAAAGVLIALLLSDSYFAYLGQLLAVYGILGLSLNLLFGYAGQVSLGHAVFFAIGAYGAAILLTRFSWHPVAAYGGAVGLSVVTAILIGLPILRLRGHFLALGTLAMGLIVHHVLIAERDWTGGHNGILVSNEEILGSTVTQALPYLFIALLLVVLWGLQAFSKSLPGKAMQMVQSSETVAASLGINVTAYKVTAFATSAGLAAVAGVLFLHTMRIITPDSFELLTSVNILLIVVIGGVGNNWGTLFGAALFVFLPETLRGFSDYNAFLYGLLVLLVLLFAPGGVAGLADSLRERWRARRSDGPRFDTDAAENSEPAEEPQNARS